jgi:hypothetical protein
MNTRNSLLAGMLALLVLAAIPGEGLAQFGLEMIVATDKLSYRQRELVNVFGNVTYFDELVDDGVVAIQVEGPLAVMALRTVSTGTSHTGGWGVNITSFYPSDDGGAPKSVFNRGGWVYFTTTVKNNKVVSQNVLLSVTIYDSTLTPVGLGTEENTLNPGASLSLLVATKLDSLASLGNSLAFANAYTDWPKDGGYSLCPEQAVNFTITSGGEAPDNPVPEQSAENGSFTVSLRMPPEPLIGVYYVYAKAWYQGNTAVFQTQFSVYITSRPADLDGDGDVDIFDIVKIAIAYGTEIGDPLYDALYDLNNDGQVNIFDIVMAASDFG